MLEMEHVYFAYGGNSVISDLQLRLEPGELLGVIGPNGAGKSTLFNLITGVVRPSRGVVRFMGRNLSSSQPWSRSRAGIGRTYQIPRPFRQMSVFENLLVGATHGAALPPAKAAHRVEEVLELTQLQRHAMKPAGALSLLDLKRLELAKALSQNPKLLLLDEIAGGLTDAECESLLAIVRQIWREGTTIIWIEHVLHALRSVARRMVVLNGGQFIVDGAPDEVLASDRVREIYIGG